MFMKTGQAQVVSAVIVVLITIGVVATVFPWAYSMIQKKKDAKSLDDVNKFFHDLDDTIRNIAKNGGEESLTLKVPGEMIVYPESLASPYNNSITFFFQSKVSNVATCDTGGEECWIPINTPNMNKTATLGKDTASVIMAKAEQHENVINIWYRVWYRELYDVPTNHGYIIALNTTDNTEKHTTTGFLRVQRLKSREVTNGKTLTITEINIII